jgi:hypothetical protein
MNHQHGRSHAADADQVVADVTATWPDDLRPDVIFVFASTVQDPAAVAARLQQRYPHALIVGCSSSGEFVAGDYLHGSTVVAALTTPRIRWAAQAIEPLSAFTAEQAHNTVEALFDELDAEYQSLNNEHYFAILLTDGLQGQEEDLTAALADALEGVVLVGGSAGDDRRFAETSVVFGPSAATDRAVVILAESDAPFLAVKHQHFESQDVPLAVTRIDPDNPRRVIEMDGRPAIEAYAAAIGVPACEVDDEVASLNPLTFRCMGSVNVRSPLQLLDDGSMVFGSAIEEGMVVDIGKHRPMVQALADELAAVTEQIGDEAFLLAHNCVFRSLEAQARGHEESLGQLLHQASGGSIGFDTYGEQFNGLHVNQTLVALFMAA